MSSTAEQLLAHTLRDVLARLPLRTIESSGAELEDVLWQLTALVPVVLGEVHPRWRYEWIDGFASASLRKLSDRHAVIFGLCYIMSDQTLAPVWVDVQLNNNRETLQWFECRFGLNHNGTDRRSINSSAALLADVQAALVQSPDQIDWQYHVAFGQQGTASLKE